MPENQFDDLLRQWQEARATHEIGFGGGGFELHVIPTGQANGYHSSPACGYVGSIFLRDAADTCYHVFASFRSRGWEPSREAFDTFLELARRTGARLESPIRNHCGGLSQGSAEADWLACMWLHKPPPPAQFGQPQKWHLPFLAAIETLEKAVLVGGGKRPTHSRDFTSVEWFGTRHRFSKGNQAETVRTLWEAWENGGHSLNQETIRREIGSSAEKGFLLSKVFRKPKPGGGYEHHSAWGTMIQQDAKGTYRLVPPKST